MLVYPRKDPATGALQTIDHLKLNAGYQHLFEFLRQRGCVLSLDNISESVLDIHSPDVLDMIKQGNERWTECVPEAVARRIVEQRLFGYAG